MLIDTHCHLNLADRFPDPAGAVAEAVEAGVERLVVVGIDESTNRLAVELADRFDVVFAAVGIHPTSTANFNPTWLKHVRELAEHPKTVAIGEIGLDYYWPDSPPADQERALIAQLDLAAELGKPVIYHCREAYGPLLDLLEHRSQPHAQVLHCFGGNAEAAKRASQLDLYFGVDGPVTYKNATELRQILLTLNTDRLVLETDSPFLPPVPFRGKPNAPSLLPWIAKGLADALGTALADVTETTGANAKRLFGFD